MTDKEQFINVFEYKAVDKVPNWEAGVWGQTKDRWIREGIPRDKVHWDWWYGEDYFGMDHRLFVPLDFGMIPPFEERVIEETERYDIYIDDHGITRKALKEGQGSDGTRLSMDQYIDFPVKNKKDFDKLKKRYALKLDKRYPKDWKSIELEKWKNTEYPVILGENTATAGYYWRCREWMGTEALCYAWYDQPDLMHEMMQFITDFTIEVARPVLKEMDFEYAMIAEDMAMKNGPLLSPDTYKTFIYPELKRLVDFLKTNGVRYVMVDTDGDPDPLIPLLLDAGIDALWPIERAADHMDPFYLRKKYGKELRLFGCVDKRELSKERESILDHLKTFIPLIEEGGFIPTVDHTVQPDVSLDNFKYYMECKDKLLRGKL